MPVVRLLGPVDVLTDSGKVSAPGSPLRRSLLALLALDAGRVVDADRLLDQAWDHKPPSSGLRALRFHISKLRADLGIDGLIETVGAGYRLEAAVDVSDVESRSDGKQHRSEIDQLLGLWRGEALADVEPCSALEHEQQRLGELRLSLTEELYQARVDEGDGARVVADLTRLCLDHPLREPFWACLIKAHYHSGHQAEALRAFDRLRVNLAETLGVDPSPALRDLERQVLGHDPDLSASAASGARIRRIGEPGNLPASRSRLIGREAELARLVEEVGSHRLVTLSGVGGMGKTHLALEAARHLSGDFRDGVWFFELGPVGNDSDVSALMASTLKLQPRSGLSIGDLVVEALSDQQMLMILDSCEHVLNGVASLVDRLLSEAAGLRIIATSREGLGIPGEQMIAVPGLPAGGPSSPAVELFRLRASEAGSIEQPDQDQLAVQLCQQLDGMPLAIELAAARARSMPLAEILDRFDDRFGLLRGRRRSVERHQTLRATVNWSYDLLDPNQRQLFDRLSVFSGPFELSDAEEVCAGDGLERGDVADLIGTLVEKSMVTNTGANYELLETLRHFGEERLALTGEPIHYLASHLAHYVNFTIQARKGLLGPDEVAWWIRLDRAWANIRAAFKWAHQTSQGEAAAGIVAHLGGFVHWHQHHEQFDWALELLEMPGVEQLELYPSCLGVAAHGAIGRGDVVGGHELALLAVASSNGPATDVDQCPHWSLAYYHQIQGNTDVGAQLYLDLANRAADLGRQVAQSCFLAGAALTMRVGRRFDEAMRLVSEARAVAEQTNNPMARSFTLATEGKVWLDIDTEHALKLIDRALVLAEPAHLELVVSTAQHIRVQCLLRLGHHKDAVAVSNEIVQSSRRQGAWAMLGIAANLMATALEALEHPEPAAQLLGFAGTLPWASAPESKASATKLSQRLEASLGAQRLSQLTEAGRQLSPQQAAELADKAGALLTA